VIVSVEKTREERDMDFQGTANALLEKLHINPVTVIVAKDKRLVPLDTDISDAKRIDILSVVSGG
jgi:sulfur carrier protein ThiS